MKAEPRSEVEADLLAREAEAVETLMTFCRIPSVSTDPAFAAHVVAAAEFAADLLRRANFPVVEIVATGGHPMVVAEWCGLPGAPTVLVYGHYDVQPPDPLELWHSPPFEPRVRDDRLFARGASDDKGPALIPILVAAAFGRLRGRPPVNLKLVLEGEEETGSPHFEATIARLRERLAADVVISADGAMWRADTPSVTVASRGLAALDVHLAGPGKDLHSGRHGGSAPNPIRALVRLLASLHDDAGGIAVAGFWDEVPPDPALVAAIAATRFDPAAYFAEIGAVADPRLSGEALLTRQWLQPTLEFNGIFGGYAGAGTKTVIPATAGAKITCRLVPGQEPARVTAAIAAHLEARLPPGYRLTIVPHGPGTEAFALDPDEPALAICEDLLAEILGARPLRVAMGATIPIGAVFKKHLGAGLVFFSFATSDEDYHAPNEFFRLASFRAGLLAWARLLEALAGHRSLHASRSRSPSSRSVDATP